MDGLFRAEAVEAQRPQPLGAIRLATPVSQQVWGLTAAAVTAAIVLWLCLGHYTRREQVTGLMVPQAGLLTVTSRSAGVVSRLNVKPGMRVRDGEALLTISSDENSAALGTAIIARHARPHSADSFWRIIGTGTLDMANGLHFSSVNATFTYHF